MDSRMAAVAVAVIGLSQGCSMLDQDGDHHGGGHGHPHPMAYTKQVIAPVGFRNANPQAAPTDRFTMAICDEKTTRCNLTVQVTGQCAISLDPQFVGLRYPKGRPLDFTLVFTLSNSPGYKFAAQPIKWQKGGNFPKATRVSDTQVEVEFRNAQQAGRFTYGILIDDAKGPCGELDPGVIPDL